MRSVSRVLRSLPVFLLLVPAASAEIVNIDASRDNSMYFESGALSNGEGQFLFAGETKDGFPRRALLAFPVSSRIPQGSTINSVTLRLNASRVANNTSRTVSLHRALRNWGESSSEATQGGGGQGGTAAFGDATWSHFLYPDSAWTTAGGDYDPVASASTGVGATGPHVWTSAQLVTDVQGWLDLPSSNRGWILIGVEGVIETAKRFDSRENTQIANRPVLEVDFTPPAGTTGACCLADLSCILTTSAACDSSGGDYQGDGTSCDPDPCALPMFTVALPPVADNTLYQDAGGSLSNGAGQYLPAGRDGIILRPVIAFSPGDSIPAGAVVKSAVLHLHNNKSGGGSKTFTLHRLLADWGEGTSDAAGTEEAGAPATPGDATWLHRFYPDSTWTTPGGDYVALASATTAVSGVAEYTWSSPLTAVDVQGWLDDPGTNGGWILRGEEGANNTAKRFESRESPTPGFRPWLEVTYAIPPADPTGACCFSDGTCLDTTGAACADLGGNYQGDGSDCATASCPVELEPFVDALPIPPVATPVSGIPGGTASYEIPMQEFTQQLHRDLPPTRVWGYGGTFPGPTILAGRDLPVSVTWINDLRDSTGALRTEHYLPVETCLHGPNMNGDAALTVVHLHGGHVPAAVDGHPDSAFAPGEQVTYVYPNNQQAATLWYHDHTLGITRLNVMMGLAGAYVLTDSVDAAVGLPSGEFDLPLIMQDRSFHADGSLDYPSSFEEHFFGDKMLVNGKVWPFLEVKQGKYRFRLLNGCNSRFLTLSLSDGAPLAVVGNDGGLLPAPVFRNSLTISPGERYEVVIDFAGYAPGAEILLENSAPIRFPGTPGEGVIPQVMKFVVVGESGDVDPLPPVLRPVPAIPESLAVMERDFLLEKQADPCAGAKWTINGLGWEDLTEQVELGTTEIWRFVNRSGVSHPMHIHLVEYQVLERQTFTAVGDSIVVTGSSPPDSSEAGWKDTSPVGPDETLRVIATFDDYPGTFVYHCHILEHEDHEMMRQFEVIVSPTAVPDGATPPPLLQVRNYPNPFGASTSITFALSRKAPVSLRIYDVTGREVRRLVDGLLEGREHSIVWDGRDEVGSPVGAGIYFLRLVAEGETLTRKMAVVR